jgi:cation diffusion facilitator family transporter
MGHSHHHHDEPAHSAVDSAVVARKRRRQAALVGFCALATLGPRLVLRKKLRNADAVLFIFSSLALASADKIRREILSILDKFKSLRDGVAKHSPPVNPMDYVNKNDDAMRVTVIGIFINLVLSAGKLAVGVACHSSALIADAGHSLSDLFSDFVTVYTVQIARLPPDDDHPYGHGKFEAIGSLFLALTLLATGVSVGAMANKQLLNIMTSSSRAASIAIPKPPALLMAALSIVSKEWLFRITRNVGERLNSQVVLANAWHHRSDAYSSVLALVSIGLAMTVPGLLAADSFAGLLVAGMICMTGADIMGESIKQLSDHTNQELVDTVESIVQDSQDVESVDLIRARQVGSQALVDVKLTTPHGLSTTAARTVEERIRRQILATPGVIDAEVHASPPTVVCPLLLEPDSRMPSASMVEACVRETALSLPNVSVEGVTVHFQDNQVAVDVDICVEADATLIQARETAAKLRELLQKPTSFIEKANIYLDLNEDLMTLNGETKGKNPTEAVTLSISKDGQ